MSKKQYDENDNLIESVKDEFVEVEGVKYVPDEDDPTIPMEDKEGENVIFNEPTSNNDDDDNEEDDEEENEDKKTVSLKKHLKLKKELKEAKKSGTLSVEDKETLSDLRKTKATKALRDAYDGEFEKLAESYPELKDKADQLFKLVQVDGNEEKSLEEVALETFGGFIQKTSSEDNESSGGGGNVDISNIDFDNMTEEQSKAVMADPKAKKAYYAYADTKN